MMIKSSDFDKRIKVKRISGTQNLNGQVKPSYVLRCELWARLQYREESRRVSGSVEQIVNRPVFTIRYNDEITESDLIELNGKEYRIDSAIPSDNQLYTIIRAYINDKG